MEQIKDFYVYKWYYKNNNKVFYIGKGSGDRYRDVSKRNQYFKDIYQANPNNCAVEIIKYFDTEDEAFSYEEELIYEYWDKDEAEANIDKGGAGGYRARWTPRMKEYFSKHNPMYKPENRQRVSEDNPMRKPECITKYLWSRGHNIIIDNICYPSVYEASRQLHKAPGTIFKWGQLGYSDSGNTCYYINEEIDKAEKAKYILPNNKPRYNAKAIIIDGVQYESIQAGANAINGRVECLSKALSAGRKYKGHTCSYANQQPSQENNQ